MNQFIKWYGEDQFIYNKEKIISTINQNLKKYNTTMKQVTNTYTSYQKLEKVAKEKQQSILQTPVSYYFRIFENKHCTALHIFYKPKN